MKENKFQFFLKSTQVIQEEITKAFETGENLGDIERRRKELILTENKNNPEVLKRHEILNVLQPFSGLPAGYVDKNRANLDPREVYIYENFTRLITLLELSLGALELFGVQLFSTERFKRIEDEFNQIVDNRFSNGEENNG